MTLDYVWTAFWCILNLGCRTSMMFLYLLIECWIAGAGVVFFGDLGGRLHHYGTILQ